MSSRVYSYIYSRVRVSVEPVMAAAAFVLLNAVEGGWGGGFGHVVGESVAPFSGEALWRIKEELGLSGPLVSFPDPGGFFLCPSLGSVDVGACFSGGGLWRFGYHLGRSGRCVDPSFSGWCLDPTFSGGLYPLWVFSSSACWSWCCVRRRTPSTPAK